MTSSPQQSSQLTTNARMFVRRHRRLLAAALAGVAALCILNGFKPAPAPTTDLVVASADLPAGHTITAADVSVGHWPTSFATGSAFTDSNLAVGRVTAGPLAAGEPIGPSRIIGPGLLDLISKSAGSAKLVAAPVRLAEAGQVGLLKPGDLVDVLAAKSSNLEERSTAGSPSAEVVASGVRVISVPVAGEAAKGGLLSSSKSSSDDGTMIVLAVDPTIASALAGAASGSRLSVVLRAA